MVMRIGGLASGMDIDELVKKLMQAERAPLNKLTQKKQTYEWQRDAYRGVNTKLKTFDTYMADNLILKSLNSKTASSSNSNLVSAVATGKASGTLSIEGVSQLATAARSTGEQVNATGSTKMSTLASGTIEFKAINASGAMPSEGTKIEVTADMTVDDFVKKVNESNAGVSAVFENGRFSFTAKNTGKGKIDITGDVAGMKLTATEGQNAIFQVNGIATERSSNSFSLNGYNVTLKDTFNSTQTIADKYKAAQTEKTNANNSYVILEKAAQDALDAYNSMKGQYEIKLASVLGSSALDTAEQESYDKFNNKKFLSKLTNDDIKQLDKLNIDPNATHEEILASISAALDSEISPELKDKLHSLTKDQLVELSNLDEAKLTNLRTEANREIKQDNYNVLDKKFLSELSSEEMKAIENIDFTKENPYDGLTITDELKAKLDKLSPAQKTALDNLSEADLTSFKELAVEQIPHDALKAAKDTAVAAEEAGKLRRDKANETFTKAESDAKAAGILKQDGTIDDTIVNAAPKAPPITITSTTNVDDMMTKIKDFVNTYNGLIKDLKNQTGETKYRDYAPLTAEQKEDMSENEIKLWEEKAKSGLLRNDDLIRSGLSNMRSLVYQSNPGIDDPKFNTLYSIGITTSKNYNEGGTLEIDEAKLRKAIEENPDAVEKLFKNSEGKKEDTIQVTDPDTGAITTKTVDSRGYLDKLRESMKNFEISIEKKAGRSTMTDAQYSIGKSLMDNEKRIENWQSKLKNIEARYWKQFTAMETAINKANSQSSMFMQGQ